MSTTKMQAPSGFANAEVQTAFGNATVDASGFVTVDSRAVAALMTSGFLVVDALRTVAGKYTVTSGDATADTLAIVTGLTLITAFSVMVLRAGKITTELAAASFATGTITMADNSTAWVVTAGDVIHWIAAGV